MWSRPRHIDFNQRDYEVDGQIGLETAPDCLGWATGDSCGECYVCQMRAVAAELWRVLRDDGTFFLNLGDKYSSDPKKGKSGPGKHADYLGGRDATVQTRSMQMGIPSKNLLGIPWRVALALQADGWILRSDIIWSKPNAMPGSQQDRPTTAHEYIFLFSKQQRYFYDGHAIREPSMTKPHKPGGRVDKSRNDGNRLQEVWGDGFSTKRSVWVVNTASEKDAHFAVFPPKLILPCILAGTSQMGCCVECGAPRQRIIEKTRTATRPGTNTKVTGDSSKEGNRDPERHVTSAKTIGWEPTCQCDNEKTKPCTALDPFMGSGTTLATAIKKNRDAIGIELNESYIEIAERKIKKAIARKGFGL